MQRVPALMSVLLMATWVAAHDAVLTDGDKNRVILENAQLRVLEYRDLPGDVTQQHHHPAFLPYARVPFRRSISLPGGKVLMRPFEAGHAIYSEAQSHVGNNVGETPASAIIAEMKDNAPGGKSKAP